MYTYNISKDTFIEGTNQFKKAGGRLACENEKDFIFTFTIKGIYGRFQYIEDACELRIGIYEKPFYISDRTIKEKLDSFFNK